MGFRRDNRYLRASLLTDHAPGRPDVWMELSRINVNLVIALRALLQERNVTGALLNGVSMLLGPWTT